MIEPGFIEFTILSGTALALVFPYQSGGSNNIRFTNVIMYQLLLSIL